VWQYDAGDFLIMREVLENPITSKNFSITIVLLFESLRCKKKKKRKKKKKKRKKTKFMVPVVDMFAVSISEYE
jgi:hypothetical protein